MFKAPFIGGMTDPPRTARVALGFLGKDISYQAQLYQDGATKTNLVMETKALTHDSRIEIPMLQNGGFAVLLQAPK